MDFENKEIAAWLEEAVKTLIGLNPTQICLAARTANGETLTAYYNCDAEDKVLMAHQIQDDVMWESIKANAKIIREIVDGEGT